MTTSHDQLLARRLGPLHARTSPDFASAIRNITVAAEPAVVFSSLAQLSIESFSDSCAIVLSEVGGLNYRIERDKARTRFAHKPTRNASCGASSSRGRLRTAFVSRPPDAGRDSERGASGYGAGRGYGTGGYEADVAGADGSAAHVCGSGVYSDTLEFAGVVEHRWRDGGHPTAADGTVAAMAVRQAVLVIVTQRLTDVIREQRVWVESLSLGADHDLEIGTAVGILMASLHVSDAMAFARLQDTSQRANRNICDVAAEVVSTGVLKA